MSAPRPITPTLNRMQAPHHGGWTRREGEECRLVDHSQLIGDFLDWLDAQGIQMAKWAEKDEYGDAGMYPHYESKERMLARYFEIDLDRADDEKRMLLDWVRK